MIKKYVKIKSKQTKCMIVFYSNLYNVSVSFSNIFFVNPRKCESDMTSHDAQFIFLF